MISSGCNRYVEVLEKYQHWHTISLGIKIVPSDFGVDCITRVFLSIFPVESTQESTHLGGRILHLSLEKYLEW